MKIAVGFAVHALFLLSTAYAASPLGPTNLRFAGTAESGIYVGVPSPDGMVPTAIAPAKPSSSNLQQAFPYDPIHMSVPAFTGAGNQYYINSADPNCVPAGGASQGTQAEPLCNIPGFPPSSTKWTLSAGDQLFIVGDGATYDQPSNVTRMTFPGTASQPIWIIGVSSPSTPRWTNQPKLNFEPITVQSPNNPGTLTHTIFYNVHFYSPTDQTRFGLVSTEDLTQIEYVTFRSVTCSGSGTDGREFGTETNSGGCFILQGSNNPVQFVVIYDSDIFGMGRSIDDPGVFERPDLHGVQLLKSTRYFWYLGNRSYHLQGDNIQCSTSNEFNISATCPVGDSFGSTCTFDLFERDRPHYIYIAGNNWYENLENGYDSKGCYHVVFSENVVHDFTHSETPPNNNAITTSQDEESFAGDVAWFLNNKLYGNGSNFAYKATTADAEVYVMGNLIVDPKKYTQKFAFQNPDPDIDFRSDQLHYRARCHLVQRDADGDGAADPITTCPESFTFAMNTVDCNNNGPAVRANINGSPLDPGPLGPLFTSGDENQVVALTGNIFKDCLNAVGNFSPHDWDSDKELWTIDYDYNVDYRGTEAGGDYNLDEPVFDSEIGNVVNQDPLFVNPNDSITGDYSLQIGSPASRRVAVEPPAYSLFSEMYGIDIRQDLSGKRWAPGTVLSSGAYQ